MSCWRVLQLHHEQQSTTVPQLLIKSQFGPSSYTVFVTDLTNIWCEALDLSGVVQRAAVVESPIEISERDTSQLTILLDNVQTSLSNNDDTACAMSRSKLDDLILHTTIPLPEPLDSLTWQFHLLKESAATLKNELILPLLTSSHVQHVRVSRLLSVISDKDRAISRLVDQYESSNLDLAAAFPSIGNTKPGRRIVKREQAARHIPGLQVFDPEIWKRGTADVVDTNASSLELFQEALSECTSTIPANLMSNKCENDRWWNELEASVTVAKRAAPRNSKTRPQNALISKQTIESDSETEDEETEDEFETHENFKSRDLQRPEPRTTRGPTSDDTPTADEVAAPEAGKVTQDGDETDEDLDAPPKVQSQRAKSPPKKRSPSPEPPAARVASPGRILPPLAKSKVRGFKIGGRPKTSESPLPIVEDDASKSDLRNEVPTRSKVSVSETGLDTKSVKKGFKIGGRSKSSATPAPEESATARSKATYDMGSSVSPSLEPPDVAIAKREKEVSATEEAREETEEEKVERKRRELKRKNEELAKKQAQSKKKKRF